MFKLIKKLILYSSVFIVFVIAGIFLNLCRADLVYNITIDGAIGPASSNYVLEGFKKARQKQASLIVLSIDTPGGLDTSMRDIIQGILSSPIPVATYVYPSGARAASAGTYILYASQIAVMSPGTNIGAATPVNMLSSFDDGGKAKGKSSSTMMEKAKNDSMAYIRSLAELNKRNVKWAELAVKKAASISAKEALRHRVVDFIASDIHELIAKANGKTVFIQGEKHTINIQNPVIKKYTIDLKTQFLLIITDPSIAYFLLLIGMYGLFIEFTNPGLIIPGVVGGIAMLVALYAMNSLPISYVGLALLVLGVMFIVAEMYVTSYGILGLGGVVAFSLGSVFLYDTESPVFQLAHSMIVLMIVLNIVILVLIIIFAMRARKRIIVTGSDDLLAGIGVVLKDFDTNGTIRIKGERWTAVSKVALKKGQRVKIINIDGLVLYVEPIDRELK